MSEEIEQQAADWFVASQGDDMDWNAFTDWLEADPRHRVEYEAIALLNDAIEDQTGTIALLVDTVPRHRSISRRLLIGIAAALAIFFVGGLLPFLRGQSPQNLIYTAPHGENREIALADTRILLAAGSTLTAIHGDPSRLKLDGGGYFVVPHRPDRALTITAGNYTIRDIGTQFEIFSTPESLRVAVATGSVTVTSDRLSAPASITSGQRLTIIRSSGLAKLGPVHAGDVASWRTGQLVYDQAPLPLVAAEVSRYAGKTVVVDPDLANRRFSGALTIGDGSHLARNLAQAAGLRLESKDDTLRLSAPGSN